MTTTITVSNETGENINVYWTTLSDNPSFGTDVTILQQGNLTIASYGQGNFTFNNANVKQYSVNIGNKMGIEIIEFPSPYNLLSWNGTKWNLSFITSSPAPAPSTLSSTSWIILLVIIVILMLLMIIFN